MSMPVGTPLSRRGVFQGAAVLVGTRAPEALSSCSGSATPGLASGALQALDRGPAPFWPDAAAGIG